MKNHLIERTSTGTMPRIHQLPHSVITKIAAGEVIERPASVVKELLENAVDAGSTRIDVDVEQGGTELIRVVDNGCGIQADDLPLAFASHATSKLASADDLFHIGTLGFRGEALASIGGVAQVTLQSRPAGQEHGAEIQCQGGDLSPVRVWNGAPGTRLEVRNLFFNTPVRRRFLRTVTTEMGHIDEAFTRLALSRTDLHLTLRHNDKPVYETPASATLADRIGLFFGPEVRDKLYAIEQRAGPVHLQGFIADPAVERGTAKMQYLFVNGRWIRDRSLGHALQEGFRGLLMTGRYAVAFLFLDMPPEFVDVNVHPTKAEVRFRDSHALYHLVLSTVRERLRAEDLTGRLLAPKVEGGEETTGGFAPSGWSLTAPPPPAPGLPFDAWPLNARVPRLPEELPVGHVSDVPVSGQADSPTLPKDGTLETCPTPRNPLDVAFNGGGHAPSPTLPLPTGSLKAIQLYDAYLVLETPEGMLVIDQHALHERILFEQLKRRIREGQLETQPLLVPEPVDLPPEQSARALEHREALAELGLQVEDFGGGTLLLRSYPALLGNRPPVETLKAVVDHLVAKDRPPSREHLLNDLLSLMACHAAVRSGDRLTPEEIAALIAQRTLAENTHHCPHGRPTSLLFSRQELDRQFRRV
jgi:DNA mismatch repair protein MutL